ncbi:MAG: Calcineurin-like phosphoesterase [Gemmataceae bacterium]|nr:Calcineurin-like phosphoesterase [Gemmataceae bacterium]
MKLVWLTDIHLNFLDATHVEEFFREVAEVPSDAILLSGDIGVAHEVALHLNALDTAVQRPVYFVLGNHDFYRDSIAGVLATVETLCSACPNLHWLPKDGVVPLTADTCLVGHDGWADGRYGDYWNSPIELNDWEMIEEFTHFGKKGRLDKLHALGDEAAAHIRLVLPDALARFRHAIVVTHVPPFREAGWHAGQISDDNRLPHFTCKAIGDVLAEAMRAHPDRQMTVLCGHTHGAGEAEILPNLRVSTGGAVYGEPKVQRVIEVG